MNPIKPLQTPDPPMLDYASLRQEGLRQLERLAGSEWTDFNEHDPGITILEQYCYALTELAYRCDFPLPDLLTREAKKTYGSLFSPARILATRPVTLVDLRKLAVDVRGVKNAWIEKIPQSAPKIFHNREGALQDQQERLIQLRNGEGAETVDLKGLYRVLIEFSEVLGVDSAEVIRKVASRLHAHRPLCMDFETVEVMQAQKIQVRASIEIEPDGNPEEIYAEVLGKIAAVMSPSVPFYTLAQRQAAGKRIDEIFDGPPLDQGFIDSAELLGMERKTSLRVSDFIHEIMDVEGVLMVKHLTICGSGQCADWWLELADGQSPVLDIVNSAIRLERQQIEVSLDYVSAEKRYLQAQANRAYRPAMPEELDVIPPKGRDRHVGRYYSAQHQFPEVYGLGEAGLPPNVTEQRRAQLKQLQAYLLFFDQLLANQFAQLEHVGDLLGFDEENPQTYFAGDLDDPGLGLGAVWQNDATFRRDRLRRIVENPVTEVNEPDWTRKNRFLDHLLARFAEQFTNHSEFRQDLADTFAERQARLAQDKQVWLRRYPHLSTGRGTGFNALRPWNKAAEPDRADFDQENCSGVEQRLRIKLGLDSGVTEDRFYLVEHVMLRPMFADMGQKDLPLMADAVNADPYSLQISLVFPAASVRFREGGGFRRFIEQTIRDEVPAHLLVYVRWLNQADMMTFEGAYQTWRDSLRTFREASEQKSLSPALNTEDRIRLSLTLRDARDRLIDLLAIGKTYPLADLPVRYAKVVAWGQFGKITLVASQPEVHYELLDKDGKSLVEAHGNGNDLDLLTPVITKDIGFAVKASKLHTSLIPLMSKDDGKIHLQSSRLDTRYELCRKDGTSFDPKIDVSGTGGELVLTPPFTAQDINFTVKAVRTLSVMLFQSIDLEVGLDIRLQATVLDAELLDPAVPNPDLADPRIVDYGSTPRVEIKASQVGVDYRLVYVLTGQGQSDFVVKDAQTGSPIPLKFISAGVVRGDSHDVNLPTLAMQEDTDLRILAKKTFNPNDNQKDQSALLNVTLPLKVRANRSLIVEVTKPLLDYRAGTPVIIKASQASASYQIFSRSILDNELVRDKTSTAIDIAGMTSLWLANPPNPTPDATAAGPVIVGNGKDLTLHIDSLKEDSLVVVRAAKVHMHNGNPPIGSSVQLDQAAAMLVRPGPDPDFPLRLKITGSESTTGASLQKDKVYQVLNGQPGVFYHFRLSGSDTDLGLPVYFHKAGKGVEELQMEIDFVLTAALPTPPPEWDCPVDLAADASLSIRAVKAQTGLEAVFERTVGDLLAAS